MPHLKYGQILKDQLVATIESDFIDNQDEKKHWKCGIGEWDFLRQTEQKHVDSNVKWRPYTYAGGVDQGASTNFPSGDHDYISRINGSNYLSLFYIYKLDNLEID